MNSTAANLNFPVFDHGGELEQAANWAQCDPRDLLDFSNLLNPQGPPPPLANFLKTLTPQIVAHPRAFKLEQALSRHYKFPAEQILVGPGSTAFIRFLPQILQPQKVLILGPTYSDYARALQTLNISFEFLLGIEQEHWAIPYFEFEQKLNAGIQLVWITRPNNPLGHCYPKTIIDTWIQQYPQIYFLIDETCFDLADTSCESMLQYPLPPNLIILRSFSKGYCVPGLRLGWLVVPDWLAGTLKQSQEPWPISTLAIELGRFLLEHCAWIKDSQSLNHALQLDFEKKCAQLSGFKIAPSVLPAFTFQGLAPSFSAQKLQAWLLKEKKMFIRVLSFHPGLGDRYFRIGLQSNAQNDLLVHALQTAELYD